MELKASSLIFFAYLGSGVALADAPSTPPTTPEPPTHHAPGMKKDWVIGMQNDLPKVLCQNDKYFVQCYNTTEAECIEVMGLYVKACLNNVIIALPPELNKHQGEYWGQMVGRCSYDLYEKFMKGKKLDKPSCQTQPSKTDDLPKPSQAIP